MSASAVAEAVTALRSGDDGAVAAAAQRVASLCEHDVSARDAFAVAAVRDALTESALQRHRSDSAVRWAVRAIAYACRMGGGDAAEGRRRDVFADTALRDALIGAALRRERSDDAVRWAVTAINNICLTGGGDAAEGRRKDVFAQTALRDALIGAVLLPQRSDAAVCAAAAAVARICSTVLHNDRATARRAIFRGAALRDALVAACFDAGRAGHAVEWGAVAVACVCGDAPHAQIAAVFATREVVDGVGRGVGTLDSPVSVARTLGFLADEKRLAGVMHAQLRRLLEETRSEAVRSAAFRS